MGPFTTVGQVYRHVESTHKNPNCLNRYIGGQSGQEEGASGQWYSYSTEQTLKAIRYVALGLISIGLKKGDTVGILALSNPEWLIADLGIMMAGGVSVTMFANISDENFTYQTLQSGARYLFVDSGPQKQMYLRHKDLFEHVILLDTEPQVANELSLKSLLKKGQELDAKDPVLFDRLLNEQKPEDLCSIIYTSGTTGLPKGAEHTHRSQVCLLHIDVIDFKGEKGRFLNILPMAHVYGHIVNITMFAWGLSIYYLNDPKQLVDVCKKIHPTFIVIVPRVLEKMYAKMVANIEQAGYMKRALGKWAFDLANQEEESLLKTWLHPIADKIVYANIREALGGAVDVVISGSAPLDKHLNHFFLDIGIPIYEGWGMTEGCPITVNYPGKRKVGSVGLPLETYEVRLAPNGELLVRGPGVMRGYHKSPELTAKVLDEEGWLHSGDKGEIDEEGFVTIVGRFKELFKTSTGEMVAPIPIEQAICKAPFIDQALVIAEGKKYVTVLLVPDFDVLHSLKSAHNQLELSDVEFLEGDFVKEETERLIAQVNEPLNNWEKIRVYKYIPQPLTVEDGLLSPTLKVKRDKVLERYAPLIESMYTEEVNI